MHALTGFQRDVPYVIAGTDSPNGLGSKGNLDDYYASVINHGGLYRNLHAQIDRGLVENGIIDDRAIRIHSLRKGMNCWLNGVSGS